MGRSGERHAARWLRRRGYRIAGRNIRGEGHAAGEADIVAIAPDRETIVIVEVKTRGVCEGAASVHLPPEAALTTHKRDTLRTLARELARTHHWGGRPIRIDGVAIEYVTRGQRVVDRVLRHYERIG